MKTSTATAARTTDLKLEIERVTLLFQQNLQGLFALTAFAAAYLLISWSVTNPTFLYIWVGVLFTSAIGRLVLTMRWRRAHSQIVSIAQVRRWEWSVEMLLFVSGCSWGAIGFRMPNETYEIQLVTSVSILLMMAGAIVAYSASWRAMMLVCFPCMSLWAGSLFLSGGQIYDVIAGMLIFIFLLSTMAGRNLNRYILRGLRLNIENAALTERLESKVASLEKAQEELRRTEEVRREQSEAEASNRAKSVLLANASHEIRTPLAAINGFTDMLLQNPTFSEDVRADLRMILRNGKYLVSLVNDLLDLSKIENGQIYIQKSFIAPLSEIQDVADLMRPMIEGRGLRFDVSLGALPSRIQTDSTRLREILINLLTNAAKFTDKGSVTMTASFDVATTLVHVSVRDSGIGVSVDGARTLFRPFTRGESERVQRVPGSGLGLALSRKLARLLGGDVRLKWSEDGVGSEFELTIDAGPGAVRDFGRVAPVVAVAAPSVARPFAVHPSVVSGGALAGRKILVVDDSKDLQILMRRFLERQGAQVDVKENGQQAVDLARDHKFDLILMDIKMPVLDGYAATKTIRSHGYTQPIVAVTAHASTDDRQRCFQSGFDSYVSKPVDFDHLVDDLTKFLPASAPGEEIVGHA